MAACFAFICPCLGGAKAKESKPDDFGPRINGTMQPPFFKQAAMDQLQAGFKPRDKDIFICTYPKCGTTWMQQIVMTLLFDGDKEKAKEVMAQAPWIEAGLSAKVGMGDNANLLTGMCGKPRTVEEYMAWDGSSENCPAPPGGIRVLKTHCMVDDVPWAGGLRGHGKSKIILVTRNPKDACMSAFAHHKEATARFPHMAAGTKNLDTFAERFFEGDVWGGCFWKWYAGWHKAMKSDSLIHWVSYEELKRDPFGATRKIADFLEIGSSDEVVAKVVGVSSFSSMKSSFAANDEKLLAQGMRVRKNHIRKGEMGSWRNDITGDLALQFDKIHARLVRYYGLDYQFDFGDD